MSEKWQIIRKIYDFTRLSLNPCLTSWNLSITISPVFISRGLRWQLEADKVGFCLMKKMTRARSECHSGAGVNKTHRGSCSVFAFDFALRLHLRLDGIFSVYQRENVAEESPYNYSFEYKSPTTLCYLHRWASLIVLKLTFGKRPLEVVPSLCITEWFHYSKIFSLPI